MDFIISMATDVGIRREINQDRMFAERLETSHGPLSFAVICDGMGGLEKGEVASSALVQAFSDWFRSFARELSEDEIEDYIIRKQWTDIVDRINAWILQYSRSYRCKMGTTVTAILLSRERYYLMNIGDTRAYEITPHRMCQLTVDHTVVQREVEKGNLTKEQGESAPMKNVLTRCVGVETEVYPDLFFGNIEAGTVYLLCSDGFRHCISKSEIASLIYDNDKRQDIKSRLEFLISLNKQRGETDNISAIAVQCIDN